VTGFSIRHHCGVGVLLAGLWFVAITTGSMAHQIDLSTARIQIDPDRQVKLEGTFKGIDIDRITGSKILNDASGLVDAGRLDAASSITAAYLVSHAVVGNADARTYREGPVEIAADQDGVMGRLTWQCSETFGDLVSRTMALIDVSPTAKQVVLRGEKPRRRLCVTTFGASSRQASNTSSSVTITSPS
jgi:hypothetical protein